MKYKANAETQVSIYKNAIVQNGNTTLFFVVKLFNYSIYTQQAIGNNISQLHNLILNIENALGTLNFSFARFCDVLSPTAYIKDFIKTIRQWDSDFTPSDEFLKNVHYTSQSYCLLAINIDDKSALSLDNFDVHTIVKDVKDRVVDSLSSFKQQRIDKEKIDSLLTKIYNIGQAMIKPCSEELLLNYYVKRIYPSYSLIIPEDEVYSTKAVLAYLQQDLTPHFNYFEMDNAGVEFFGAKSKTTYGSVIDIIEFPEEICSEAFAMNFDWLVMNCKTLSKRQAKLKFSRKRSDIEYEKESAAHAASADAYIELEEYKDLADTALAAISAGYKIVQSDIHILVLASSLKELNQKRFGLIAALKNMEVIATFAPDQAKEYVDSFVKLRPEKYPYLMDLRYPLSFRMPQGAVAGDFDSKFTAPIFGESASSDDAIDQMDA